MSWDYSSIYIYIQHVPRRIVKIVNTETKTEKIDSTHNTYFATITSYHCSMWYKLTGAADAVFRPLVPVASLALVHVQRIDSCDDTPGRALHERVAHQLHALLYVEVTCDVVLYILLQLRTVDSSRIQRYSGRNEIQARIFARHRTCKTRGFQ